MNVLVLGYIPSQITPIIKANSDFPIEEQHPIDVNYLIDNNIDWIVSFGYRHIIKKPIIEYLKGNVINLHISFLPWNRGADPNLWSFLEDTPKGVTIHYIDEGMDTGNIIVQKRVYFDTGNETVASTYNYLKKEIIILFEKEWVNIKQGKIKGILQGPGGSFHLKKDKKKYEYLFSKKGWETPVKLIIGKVNE